MSAPSGVSCAACGLSLPRSSFSTVQLKKSADARRCKECTSNDKPIDANKANNIREAVASQHANGVSNRSFEQKDGDDPRELNLESLLLNGDVDGARALSEPGDHVTRAELRRGQTSKLVDIHSMDDPDENMLAWGEPIISANMMTNISNRRDAFGPNAPPFSPDSHRNIRPPTRTLSELRRAAAPAESRNYPSDPVALKALGQACLELGDVLMSGYRTTRKPNEACDWYWRSADSGNPEGLTQCAQICLKKLEADNVLISSEEQYVAPGGSQLLKRHQMFIQLVELIARAYVKGGGYVSSLAFRTLQELKKRGIVDMRALARANVRGADECVEALEAAEVKAKQDMDEYLAEQKAGGSNWMTRDSVLANASAARASSSSSSAAASTGVLGCSGCGRSPLTRSEFSSAQLKKPSSIRRCKHCVSGGSADEPGADDAGPGHAADAAEPGGVSRSAASSSSSSSSSSFSSFSSSSSACEMCNPVASSAPAECPILLANPNSESDAVCGQRHVAAELESLLLADHHWRRAFPVNTSEEGRDATFSKSYASELECAACQASVRKQALCKCRAVAYCTPRHRDDDAAKHGPLCALLCEEAAPAPEGLSAEEQKHQLPLQRVQQASQKIKMKCFIGPADSTACFHVIIFFTLLQPSKQPFMYFMSTLIRHGQGLRSTTMMRGPEERDGNDPIAPAKIDMFLEMMNPDSSNIPSWRKLFVEVSPDVATLFILKGLRDQEEGSQPPDECAPSIAFCRMMLKQGIVSGASVLHSLDSYKAVASSPAAELNARLLQISDDASLAKDLKQIPRQHVKTVVEQLPISTANYPRDLYNVSVERITWHLWSTLNLRSEYCYEASLVSEVFATLSAAQQRGGGSDADAVERAVKSGRLTFAAILSRFDEPSMRLRLHRRLTWFAFHQALWHSWRNEIGLSVLFQLQVDALDAPGAPVGKVPLARALVIRSCPIFDRNLQPSLPEPLVTINH